MVSTRFGLRRETFFEGFNPPPTTMIDTGTLHEDEMRKMKADHDQLKARVRRP